MGFIGAWAGVGDGIARSLVEMGWTKSIARTLLITASATVLAGSTLVCPLWIGFGPSEIPCTHDGGPTEQCPVTICAASSSYVASDVGMGAPVLIELHAEAVVPGILWTALAGSEVVPREELAPPRLGRPLFLQTHSLLV
jgi:hypothetical protein